MDEARGAGNNVRLCEEIQTEERCTQSSGRGRGRYARATTSHIGDSREEKHCLSVREKQHESLQGAGIVASAAVLR